MNRTSDSQSCTNNVECSPPTTALFTGTATGGVSPYSYLWEYVSGDTNISPLNSTSASTRFQVDTPIACSSGGITQTAVWKLKVTDNASTIAYGADCTINMTNNETTCA
jgi:hypothetical protein